MKTTKYYPEKSKHGVSCETVKSDLTPSFRRKIRRAAKGRKLGGLPVAEIAAIKTVQRLGKAFK